MIRLGPLPISGEVDASPAKTHSTVRQAPDTTDVESSSTSSEINREDDIDAARLEPTDHPGFVLLYVRPRADCKHSEWLPLSGAHVKTNIELIGNRGTAKADTRSWPIGNLMTGGPSLSSKEGGIDADLVPCFSLPRWPCEEFRRRPRPHGQPAPALVERLCRVAAMLVAVGFKGSDTERDQWRLSFSKHEYILLQSLTELQRDCLVVLKYCCAVLFEPHGPIKGAYLKMALLWECEETDPKTWEEKGLRNMTIKVLARLRDYVQKGRLPCYFWSNINMLAMRDEKELERLQGTMRGLINYLYTAAAEVVAALSWYGDSGVTHRNLPSGGIEEHWKFVLHRHSLWDLTSREATWLKENFIKLLDKQVSPMELMYQRVLKEISNNREKHQGHGAEPFKDDWLEEE
ncbi:hypothetical protein FJT64_006413 [Amphibalanus amphitrite]|uniref:Uncharacterized protein n=1 Tax=Amphibalanus amphitrite TaxID=1232801 RepID=A0A6A4VZ27_AMPAM|nr:hypothetical protein FJT64_006413 [Amphibalanus amphitrite]